MYVGVSVGGSEGVWEGGGVGRGNEAMRVVK